MTEHAPLDAEPAEPAPAPAPERRFRRDRRHKTLGGVCAGLGRTCDMDPVIFRIGLAVLAVTGGIGLIFYGFAWLFVPYDDEEENEFRKLLTGRVDGPGLAAIVTALVGCGVFLSMLNNGGALTFAAVLALLLAGTGYWSQQRRTTDPDPVAAQAVADAPPEAKAPPVSPAPSWWRDPIVKDGTYVGGTGYFWGPADAVDPMDPVDTAPQDAGPRDPLAKRPTAPPKRREPRGGIGALTFLAALVAGALGAGLTWESRTLGDSLQTGFACALGVFGLSIAISAFRGRTGAGSIVLAIVTAGLLAGSAALPANITTEWIRTNWTPASAADVQSQYEVGSGVGTLDLSRVDVADGKKVETHVEVGAGQAKIILPKADSNDTVEMHIEVGLGDVQLPGDTSDDIDIRPGQEKRITFDPPSGSKASGKLEIHLEVGLGQAEVSRAA
ncbi:PspC domain-containing protein [Streptomyces sp. NPDC050095]|uniref:PspC domain-containing protein n=1 Tax=unclassified Streptomyces TaxID=2593676 RepID=UPI00341C484D